MFTVIESEIGAMVNVDDSHPCGWSSIPDTSCSFFYSLLAQGLITVLYVFMMTFGFPLTSSLLLDHHNKHTGRIAQW